MDFWTWLATRFRRKPAAKPPAPVQPPVVEQPPVVVVPPTPEPTPPTPPVTAPTGKPLFNGDYSTGDFSQWVDVQNHSYNGPARNYRPAYPATIVIDPAKGYAARYEVRAGDGAIGESGSSVNRSEVSSAGNLTGGVAGQARWYRFSTKFDTAFPQNHASLGWGVTNQWHPSSSGGSPPVGWTLDHLNGHWSLWIENQSAPGKYVRTFSIWDTPLDVGNWHDVKMQIFWSPTDDGWIRLWHNGVRQTFLDGSDTYRVKTMIPGAEAVYYKEGYYRKAMAPTGVVYHAGFRSATTEADLT